MDIRDTLNDIVEERCIRIVKLAEKAGMTSTSLYDVLRKRRRLEANEMFRLCRALEIAPEELYRQAEDND